MSSEHTTDTRLTVKIRNWCAAHPYLALTLLTVAVLAPFLAKPFNIDDPLFVWAARQIQAHPGNPYGFDVNWYGFTEPLWQATQNPPLMSYYLAVAVWLSGGSEISLHLAGLLPALAVTWGAYRLARNVCTRPMLAALVTLFCPGLLVSSTTVMCDVLMLAFWIWALVFWLEGIRQDHFLKLAGAGLLAALAVLAKYSALCLIPLLAAYAVLERRAWGRWGFQLLIPFVLLAVQEWFTWRLYGQSHFLFSQSYAQHLPHLSPLARYIKALNVLTFCGGCFATAALASFFLWQRRTLSVLLLAIAVTGLMGVANAGSQMDHASPWPTGGPFGPLGFQVWLWTLGGLSLVALALAELVRKRDSISWLLAFWVIGTLVFAAFFYWLVNARVLLPLAPAVAILIARRWEDGNRLPAGVPFAVVVGAVLSLLAMQADFQMADTARKGAQQICATYAGQSGRVWFQGHWGFQYYMQAGGARPVDVDRTDELRPGDWLVQPLNNSSARLSEGLKTVLVAEYSAPNFPWLATMNVPVGAGFYSQLAGPSPFVFGSVSPEKFWIFQVKSATESGH